MKNTFLISLIFLFVQTSFAQILVKDIASGTSSSYPTEITVVGNVMYFTTRELTSSLELWRSYGEETNTEKVLDLNGPNFASLENLNNKLIIIESNTISFLQNETSTIPTVIKNNISVNAASIIQIGGDMYFLGTESNIAYLYKYNFGTSLLNQTLLVYGFYHFQPYRLENQERLKSLIYDETSGIIYFKSNDFRIYAYDINSGILYNSELFNSVSYEYPLVLFNGYVYTSGFQGSFSNYTNTELIKVKYNASIGEVELSYIELNPVKGSFPIYFTVHNDEMFFFIYSGLNEFQSLVKMNSSGVSSQVVYNLGPDLNEYFYFGFNYENPFRMIDDNLYLINRYALYKLSPEISEVPVIDIDPSSDPDAASGIELPFKVSDQYFCGRTSHNPQIHNSIGFRLTQFEGLCDCWLGPFILFNGEIYFSASMNLTGWELYKIPLSIFSSTENKYKFSIDSFSIFPNPVSNKLFISSDLNMEILNVEVFNSIGEVVLTKIHKDNSIDISHLNSGCYFIKISSDNGSTIRKFVKN